MDFVILIHSDETAPGPVPGTPEFAEYLSAWGGFNAGLREGGHLVAGAGLQPSATARTVHRGLGAPATVTDGPYVETKEQLGGFYLVTADDLDAATELAHRLPLPVGSVEVRPVSFRADQL